MLEAAEVARAVPMTLTLTLALALTPHPSPITPNPHPSPLTPNPNPNLNQVARAVPMMRAQGHRANSLGDCEAAQFWCARE